MAGCLIKDRGNITIKLLLHFSFGATAHLWALAYLHETFRFTSVY
jgi:hypothetical protein